MSKVLQAIALFLVLTPPPLFLGRRAYLWASA